jgi:hypothetical protein
MHRTVPGRREWGGSGVRGRIWGVVPGAEEAGTHVRLASPCHGGLPAMDIGHCHGHILILTWCMQCVRGTGKKEK